MSTYIIRKKPTKIILNFFPHKVPAEGSMFWIFLLTMLQGLCGTTIGLIISAVCKTQQDATQIGKKYMYKGPSINDATHLGEIADLPKGDVSP